VHLNPRRTPQACWDAALPAREGKHHLAGGSGPSPFSLTRRRRLQERRPGSPGSPERGSLR